MALRLLSVAAVVIGCAACASNPPVYQYQGLKPATGAASTDGIFQDFSSDADTLARIWADPDATMHKGKSQAWARARIDRTAEPAHLSVDFERTGYGVSIELAPTQKTPERIPEDAKLVVELRSQQNACVGLRFMEGDGEVWGYGKAPLDYKRLCVSGSGEWQSFELPLSAEHWFPFIYGGNVNLGNKVFDRDIVAMMSFELGLDGDYYFSPGEATIDIRQIRLIGGSPAELAAL